MKTIWKYEINHKEATHEIPNNAKVLHAGHDPQGRLCFWAVVDPTADKQQLIRTRVEMTGQPFGSGDRDVYLGSVVEGPLVLHVFVGA